MPNSLRLYRVTRPTAAAVQPDGGKHPELVFVPAGSLLTIRGEADDLGLVPVTWDQQKGFMFLSDIQDRGEALDNGATAGATA